MLSETVHPPKWQNKRYASVFARKQHADARTPRYSDHLLYIGSCQRWHPLVCINQALLLELKWIRDFHRMASDERRSATYAKGMAAIKSYPYLIKSAKEAEAILGVGEKIASQCGEFVKTGKIEAAGMLDLLRLIKSPLADNARVMLQSASRKTRGMSPCLSSRKYTVLAAQPLASFTTSITAAR